MNAALSGAVLALYLAGAVIYLAFALWQKRGLHSVGRLVLWAGFGLHTLALVLAWAEAGVFPALSLRQYLNLFAWALMGSMLLVNLRLQLMILGAVIAPLCSLMILAASALPISGAAASPLLKSLWVTLHVTLMLFGYGLLSLSFLSGVLYMVQERLIRRKRLGPVFQRLPSLNRLDMLQHRSLVAGFSFLTLGLITGALYAQVALGSYWRWDPKEVWSLITWLLYAGLLHARLVSGWRGFKGAVLSTAAFAALLFTFLGAGLILPGYHSFENIVNLTGPLK